MKPAVVWQLHQQRAFDRAMQLQFARVPNNQAIIETFRQQLVEGITRAASREGFAPAAEHTVKYGVQIHPPQLIDAPPPPATEAIEEEWLEVRYRFVDDKTAEIVSVTSQTLPI